MSNVRLFVVLIMLSMSAVSYAVEGDNYGKGAPLPPFGQSVSGGGITAASDDMTVAQKSGQAFASARAENRRNFKIVFVLAIIGTMLSGSVIIKFLRQMTASRETERMKMAKMEQEIAILKNQAENASTDYPKNS